MAVRTKSRTTPQDERVINQVGVLAPLSARRNRARRSQARRSQHRVDLFGRTGGRESRNEATQKTGARRRGREAPVARRVIAEGTVTASGRRASRRGGGPVNLGSAAGSASAVTAQREGGSTRVPGTTGRTARGGAPGGGTGTTSREVPTGVRPRAETGATTGRNGASRALVVDPPTGVGTVARGGTTTARGHGADPQVGVLAATPPGTTVPATRRPGRAVDATTSAVVGRGAARRVVSTAPDAMTAGRLGGGTTAARRARVTMTDAVAQVGRTSGTADRSAATTTPRGGGTTVTRETGGARGNDGTVGLGPGTAGSGRPGATTAPVPAVATSRTGALLHVPTGTTSVTVPPTTDGRSADGVTSPATTATVVRAAVAGRTRQTSARVPGATAVPTDGVEGLVAESRGTRGLRESDGRSARTETGGLIVRSNRTCPTT